MTDELLGCKSCGLSDVCPVLNKLECPINRLWVKATELAKAKEELVAEAERIVAGREAGAAY